MVLEVFRGSGCPIMCRSSGWLFVLVSPRAVFAVCDEVTSVVAGFVPLPRHAAMRHSFCIRVL